MSRPGLPVRTLQRTALRHTHTTATSVTVGNTPIYSQMDEANSQIRKQIHLHVYIVNLATQWAFSVWLH